MQWIKNAFIDELYILKFWAIAIQLDFHQKNITRNKKFVGILLIFFGQGLV